MTSVLSDNPYLRRIENNIDMAFAKHDFKSDRKTEIVVDALLKSYLGIKLMFPILQQILQDACLLNVVGMRNAAGKLFLKENYDRIKINK